MNVSTTQLSTPNIENVKPHLATVSMYVDMDLAGIPVTVIGQYNINSNCYYPSTIMPNIRIMDGETVIAETTTYSLQTLCEKLDWDEFETHDAIQAAVENR